MYNRKFDGQIYRGSENEKENQLGQSYNLRHMRVELTHDCPLHCLHCSACSSSGNPLRIPPERVISLINEFIRMGGKEVVITGGEPLIYDGLLEVLKASNSAGIKPILFTSGVIREGKECRCINDEELVRMKSLLSRAVFSLYSADKEKHDHITQTKKSFELTLDSIRKSIILGIPTDIHFVPMRVNYKDLPSLVELSCDLGVQRVRVLRFVPHGRGKNYVSDLLPSVKDYRIFAELVNITRIRYADFINIGAAFSALIPNVSNACSAATSKIVVTADGFVAPCDGFKNFGNSGNTWSIYNKPLYEIYINSPLLCQVRAAGNGNTKEGFTNKIPTKRLGCTAQKSLACGYITNSVIDPCVSTDSVYIEARDSYSISRG
jgi:MoaA/NifB/PqqE/SkfB family radical SAM enzyme